MPKLTCLSNPQNFTCPLLQLMLISFLLFVWFMKRETLPIIEQELGSYEVCAMNFKSSVGTEDMFNNLAIAPLLLKELALFHDSFCKCSKVRGNLSSP